MMRNLLTIVLCGMCLVFFSVMSVKKARNFIDTKMRERLIEFLINIFGFFMSGFLFTYLIIISA